MSAVTDKAALFAGYWAMLAAHHAEPVREYKFWKRPGSNQYCRFDFAWPEHRIAVEVDGNAWHVKGGGRHGQSKDYEKINAAVLLGWRVLRFTPAMLTNDPATAVQNVIDLMTRERE